jgi:F-type H+-transporting ATPase subunit delta
MIDGSLSRRYTKALFQLAQESQQEEVIGRELQQFYGAYRDSELQAVLTNPAVDLDKRNNILLRVTQMQQLAPLMVHFLAILLARDRLKYLPEMVSWYRRLFNDARGRVEAKAVAASPLELRMVDQLRQVLQGIVGKEVVLQQETDPSLIGGVLIELEGKVYDGSVRTQLEKMKQRIGRGY